MMELYCSFTLECSHSLEQPIGTPILHGHSYWVRVFFDSTPDKPVPLPMVQGYCDLLKNKMDHRHLNDFIQSPTMEAIAQYVFDNIQGEKPVRIEIERKSIGAGVVFYPKAHGASFWRAKHEYTQAEIRHMKKSVDMAWDRVEKQNKFLIASGLQPITK